MLGWQSEHPHQSGFPQLAEFALYYTSIYTYMPEALAMGRTTQRVVYLLSVRGPRRTVFASSAIWPLLRSGSVSFVGRRTRDRRRADISAVS